MPRRLDAVCWFVQNISVLSTVHLHCVGHGAATKNKTQRAERRQMCPHAEDQRGPRLHFRGRLPGGGDAGAESITPSRREDWGPGPGCLLTLQPFPKQPHLVIYYSCSAATSLLKQSIALNSALKMLPASHQIKHCRILCLVNLAIVPPTKGEMLLLMKKQTLHQETGGSSMTGTLLDSQEEHGISRH